MENKVEVQPSESAVKLLNQLPLKNKSRIVPVFLMLAAVLLGIGSGVLVSMKFSKAEDTLKGGNVANSVKNENKEAGIADEKAFPDTANGVLKEGGIDGEGMYHLEREGGPSQNVYLVSSVVDLSKFIDKRVQVWGQTFAGKKAGWLMDVGRVKVLD